ncbi:hypothetical protein N3K66_001796 [Trichothecium roseum]|uniref:Uncharacterized protein n=1 Tax=Trichothecium roseum TaxID=47278 RepID=A0ACC0V8A4_9HYPO|nr:hypothetical protein N3K66_001796 [Trichothecium roseum]
MYSTPGPWSWLQGHWTFVAPEETAATARGQPQSPRDYSQQHQQQQQQQQQQQHHYSRWQSGAHHNSYPSAGLVASSPAAAAEYARPPGDVTEDEWLPCFPGAEFPSLLHDPISNSHYRHPPTSTTTTLYPSPEPPVTTSITTNDDDNNDNNNDDSGYDYCYTQPSHANSPSSFQQNNPWDNQHHHHQQHPSTLSSYDMVYGAPAPLTNSLDAPTSAAAAASHHQQQAPGFYPTPSTQPHAAAAAAYPFAGCRCTCHPLCYATPYSAQPPPWQTGSTQQEHNDDDDHDDNAPPQDEAVQQRTWGVTEHPALPVCLTLDHPQVTHSSSSSSSSSSSEGQKQQKQQQQQQQQSTLPDTTLLPNQALDTPALPDPSQQSRTTLLENQTLPSTTTTTTTRKRGRSSVQGYDAATPPYYQPPQDAAIMPPPPPPPRVVPILHSQTAAGDSIIGSSVGISSGSSLRPGSQRPNVDEVIYRGRREGLSYAEIKRGWRLPQSESTLRGRYHKIKRRFEREGS